MGIFNRKNKKNNQTESKLTLPCFLKGKEKLENILFYNIEALDISVKHRDGKKGKLMLSQIQKIKEDGAINQDLADYIVFEITEGKEIDKELLQKVAFEYDKTIKKQEACKYLGQFDGDDITFSKTVKQYVEEKIVPIIMQRRQDKVNQQKKAMEEREERNNQEYRKSLNCNQYIEKQAKINNERKNNPYLKKVMNISKDNKIFENYDGININTGEILRIRELEKVEEYENGTYLYRGYIHSVPNVDCVEELRPKDRIFGKPVCFELSARISDIVKNEDKQQIDGILKLLSDANESFRKVASSDELYYLGGINKEGEIYTAEESESKAIKYKVEKLRREYKMQSKNKEEYTL